MKNALVKIPMPIVGLMLAFAALGNLVQSYGEIYRHIFGTISTIIFIIVTIKFLTDFQGLKRDLATPIGASVFPTYSMCIMLLATYVKPYNSDIAYAMWIVGILLHLILLISFSLKFIKNFNIMQVFPSWFIVYVGIAVAAVTGKAFNQIVGQWAFAFAFVCLLFLIVLVGKRVFFIKDIPEPALPTIIIFSAPASLCLAGYINSFDTKNMILFWFLLALSQGFYIFAIIKLFVLLNLPFYPSYSGFTFPLVISALALKLSNGFLTSQGIDTKLLSIFVKAEELISVAIVCYVFIRYLNFLVKSKAN